MFSIVEMNLKELNPLITCSICCGYLIDATSLAECHHSFCRSCVMKHVMSSNVCPVCGMVIHKTKPELNLITDKNLQQIVYKLVPGLLKDELRRRHEFFSNVEDRGTDNTLSVSDYSDKMETDDIKICILINIIKASPSDGEKILFSYKSKKYLFCPGLFTLRLLKKFVSDKCELDGNEHVEVIHARDDEFLPDHYTLLDVANVYNWRADSPLELKCVVWSKSIFVGNQDENDVVEEESISDQYPFKSFKEFYRHLTKTSRLCPILNPKKHKDKQKHGLKDITNVTNINSNCELISSCQDVSSHENLCICKESCKLKLRIRTKGAEDSVLILSPESSGFVLSDEGKNQTAVQRSRSHVPEEQHISVSQILEEQKDNMSKKFMSKKDMFFSKLSIENYDTSDKALKPSEIDVKKDRPFFSSLNIMSKSTFGSCPTHEPLNITIEKPNILNPSSSSDPFSFKKRLLLATVPTRTRGQLWTPYKSPTKELCGDISENGVNLASSAESDRSKSPVIVFNPALPLPSFTSLLQSFDSTRSSHSLNTTDFSFVDNSQLCQITSNSKIGIFISKGRSMTLEEKTKLKSEQVSQDDMCNTNQFQDKSSDNNNLEEGQSSFIADESHGFIVNKTDNDDKECNQINYPLRCRQFPVDKNNSKLQGNVSETKRKTPLWLAKKIQLKKTKSFDCKMTGEEKSIDDDDLKSPHRKKCMIMERDNKNENASCVESSVKRSLSSRICNISKRALKIIN